MKEMSTYCFSDAIPHSVKVVEVIEVRKTVKPNNALNVEEVVTYWTKDGEFLGKK